MTEIKRHDIDDLNQIDEISREIQAFSEGEISLRGEPRVGYSRGRSGSLQWNLLPENIPLPQRVPVFAVENRQEFEQKVVDFLAREIPNFLEIKQVVDREYAEPIGAIGNRDFSRKNKVLKGPMQSGKTWRIIGHSLYTCLIKETSALIVLENKLSACEQFVNRFRTIFTKLTNFLEQNNIPLEKLLYILDIKRGKEATRLQIKNALNGRAPRIFVILRSEFDLEPVNRAISRVQRRYFTLLIDESDALDSGSDSSAQQQLEILKEMATTIWSVSATPITSLLKEPVRSEELYFLSPPVNYKGLNTALWESLPLPAEHCDKIQDNPFQKDANLEGYLRDFSQKEPINLELWDVKHPRIALVRVGTAIEPQLKIASYIQRRYGDRITSITYNGSGLTLRGNSLPKRNIPGLSIFAKGIHTVTKYGIGIGEVLDYLRDEGVERHPRIVVLAGKMADRGITFCTSNWEEAKLPWHLTEMYYIPAKGTDQAGLLQACGRSCGTFVDNIQVKIYSNAIEDIKKAYHVQEELITRARDGSHCFMRDSIQNTPISREKLPTGRRISAPRIRCSLKRVKDDRKYDGWDWEEKGWVSSSSSDDAKDDEIGVIFVVNPDNEYPEATQRDINRAIDAIPTSDRWVSRASIVNDIVEKHGCPHNTIRASLTRIKDAHSIRTDMPKYGLNFRRKSGRGDELEVLYHANV